MRAHVKRSAASARLLQANNWFGLVGSQVQSADSAPVVPTFPDRASVHVRQNSESKVVSIVNFGQERLRRDRRRLGEVHRRHAPVAGLWGREKRTR